jgi:ABC-type molybdate transport system permease subunit
VLVLPLVLPLMITAREIEKQMRMYSMALLELVNTLVFSVSSVVCGRITNALPFMVRPHRTRFVDRLSASRSTLVRKTCRQAAARLSAVSLYPVYDGGCAPKPRKNGCTEMRTRSRVMFIGRP